MSEDTTKSMEQTLDAAAAAVTVQTAELASLAGGEGRGEPLGLGSLMSVKVEVTVEVGRTQKTIAEVVDLAPGVLVTLDRAAHEPVDILVNGRIVGRGEVVTIDDKYGVRITSLE
jgi:flagellar motor switch protein FliN/FliY